MIILLFLIVSCNSQHITNTEYQLINVVIDSLVKQSRKDSIGLKIETLNNSWVSKELIMNPGFNYYESGKAINECPDNNVSNEKFSTFNYETFKSSKNSINTKKITNSNVTTCFQLKTKYYKDRLDSFIKNDSTINKKDLLEAFWENERTQSIYQISSPLFSDDTEIAVVFTHALNMVLQSWALNQNKVNKWFIQCVEQITIE